MLVRLACVFRSGAHRCATEKHPRFRARSAGNLPAIPRGEASSDAFLSPERTPFQAGYVPGFFIFQHG